MIGTLLRLSWLNLKRDRVAQALTFVLPIVFFSIFAAIMGNQSNPTRRIRVAVVDEDHSTFSRQLVQALEAEGALRIQTLAADGTTTLDAGVTVRILADVSDPIAPQVVQGLLQKVSFTAAPDAMAVEGLGVFEQLSGPMTEAQRQSVDQWLTELAAPLTADSQSAGATSAAADFGLKTELVNVLKPDQGDTTTISYYAAGIGVMFLLFSFAGAGGTLLEEQESGTLERLIGSRAGMVQLTVMFTWGALMFGLPLLDHVPGFIVMTAATAPAAAGFGLLLATISRSRAQLSGISTILILMMSALGGSMFPRFMMSETMQQVGLATFNAWALDGFIKVFWRDVPLLELWPQVLVLVALTAVFLTGARLFARRWETIG